MTLNEVKQDLFEIIYAYFTEATVVWGDQIMTKPALPYVVLKITNLSRKTFPVDSDIDFSRYYHCMATLEVNLFTKGEPIFFMGKETGNFANTALSDLVDFADYMESIGVTDHLYARDINVSLSGVVRDLTTLENNSSFRYRAVAEFSVNFTIDAFGMYGNFGRQLSPNNSGGGSIAIATKPIQPIESVNVSYEKEENSE